MGAPTIDPISSKVNSDAFPATMMDFLPKRFVFAHCCFHPPDSASVEFSTPFLLRNVWLTIQPRTGAAISSFANLGYVGMLVSFCEMLILQHPF